MSSNHILAANEKAFARAVRYMESPSSSVDRETFDCGWEEGIYFACQLTEDERQEIFEAIRPVMEAEE